MSTQQFTVDPAVAAWSAQVRALRAEHGRAITDAHDPRYVKLAEEYPKVLLNRNPSDLGEFYFDRYVSLPTFPQVGPDWSSNSDVDIPVNDWPIVEVWHYSDWVEKDRIRARSEQYEKVAVDVVPDDYNVGPDGSILDSYVPQAGEIHGRELRVLIEYTNTLGRVDRYDIDLESAGALIEVLKQLTGESQ